MRRVGVVLASLVMLGMTAGLATNGISAAGAQGQCDYGLDNGKRCGGHDVNVYSTKGGALYKNGVDSGSAFGGLDPGAEGTTSPGSWNYHQGSLCKNGPVAFEENGTVYHVCAPVI